MKSLSGLSVMKFCFLLVLIKENFLVGVGTG